MNHHSAHDMEELIAAWKRRVKRNLHVVWASIGDPGSGKSETNLLVGSELQGYPIDVETQVAFRPKDRILLAQRLPRFTTVLDDESSGEGGNKRRSMSTSNVDNMMDLDACRGRNQFMGFAAPRWNSLDSVIQNHVMWLFAHHLDHSMKAYEMIEVGPPTKRERFPKLRFTVAKVPFLGDKYPEVRTEYLAAKERHMRGGSTDTARQEGSLTRRYQAIVGRVLD